MNTKITVLLKVAISLGLIVFLINQVNFKEIVIIMKEVDVAMIIYALIFILIQIFIATIRWLLVLQCQKITLDYKNILQILWIGLFFNQAMPSSVGGDVIRGYYLKKQGSTLGSSTLGVLMDRLFGMMGLTILVLATIPLLFDLISDPIARTGMLFIALGIFLSLLFVFFTDKLPGNFSHFKIIRGFYSLSIGIRRCLSKRFNGLFILIVSILIHFLSVVIVMIIAIGLGMNINFGGFFLIIPLVTLIMVVPISIAGWGVREGVMVVGFGYLGVSPELALALSILYGLSVLIVALPGGVIWMFKRSHSINKS